MTTNLEELPVVDGQFDDAPEEAAIITPDPRVGHSYIDDENILEWSSESADDEEDQEIAGPMQANDGTSRKKICRQNALTDHLPCVRVAGRMGYVSCSC